MRWWHALILAAGLVMGGALSGGIYTPSMWEGDPVRFNRFTGSVDWYRVDDKGFARWMRMPNDLDYSLVNAPKMIEALRRINRERISIQDLDALDQAVERVRQKAATPGR